MSIIGGICEEAVHFEDAQSYAKSEYIFSLIVEFLCDCCIFQMILRHELCFVKSVSVLSVLA